MDRTGLSSAVILTLGLVPTLASANVQGYTSLTSFQAASNGFVQAQTLNSMRCLRRS
jgi:hypothetical protein